MIACAELEIPLIYAPAPNAGATAPRSMTAAVLVADAEVLSGLVLHQHVRPGAPFVYGAGAGALDMRHGTDPYGVPEHHLALLAACDLARHYGLLSFSYAAVSDSKTLDEQWSAEAAVTCMLGTLSRATLLHDVGYLESGLQSSYESVVLGDELVGYARAFLKELPIDEHALALEEITVVGPGGSHLARKYTRKHHRDFWQTTLLSHEMHDRWLAGGGSTLGERVHERVRQLRAEPRPLSLTGETDQSLERILADAARQRGGG